MLLRYVIFVDFTGRMSLRSHISPKNFESQIENHFIEIVGKAECPWARALPFFITFFLQFLPRLLEQVCIARRGFRVLFLVEASNFKLNLERIELLVEVRRRSAVLLLK
jgi:hypothetical protein